MATSLTAALPYFISYKSDNVTPNAGGKIYTYERQTTTNKVTYADAAKTTPLANPIILDSAGGAVIYWDGEYDIRMDNSDDVTIRTVEDFNLQDVASSGVTDQEGNLVINGSFEIDTDGDGLPDGWSVVQNGTVTLDTSEVLHGQQAVKFVSTGISGGGVLTSSSFMNVQQSKSYVVKVNYKADHASIRTVIEVEWFTEADASISKTVVMDITALSLWQENTYIISAPATATRAKIILTGIHTSSPVASQAYFDNMQMFALNSIDIGNTGTVQTIQSNLIFDGTLGINEISPDTRLHVTDSAVSVVTIESTNAGASAGPNTTLYRNSSSPANGDSIGSIVFDGKSSTGVRRSYAQILGFIDDTTNTAEDSTIIFKTLQAGSLTQAAYIKRGLTVGSPTGGDQPAGSVNAEDYFIDGTQLYSAGTFTPNLDDSAGGTGETYGSNNEGFYMQIGDYMFVWGTLHMATLGSLTTSNPAQIDNLPATAAASWSGGAAISDISNVSITSGAQVSGYTDTNSDKIHLWTSDNATGGSAMLVSEVTALGQMRFHASYKVA